MASLLQPDLVASHASITAYEPGRIDISGTPFLSSVIVSSGAGAEAWHVQTFEDLRAEDLSALRRFRPELVLLGTGRRHHMLSARLAAGLCSLGPQAEPPVGVESMDTAAACRTFNLLASEGRRVVAALIVQPPTSSPKP